MKSLKTKKALKEAKSLFLNRYAPTWYVNDFNNGRKQVKERGKQRKERAQRKQ